MRADRTQSCKRRWNPLPAAVLRLTGMLFVSEVTAHPLKWQFSDCTCVCCLKPSFVSRHILAAADVDDLHQGRLFDCDVQVNTANKLIRVLLNDKCASVPHGTSSTCLIFAAVMISFEKFCKY